jgi:membrane-bound ClpP family serine protease
MAKKSVDKLQKDNSFGIASVVLGILSVVFSLTVIIGSFAGITLGVVSLIFSLKQNKIQKNKWSSAGLILSISGIALGIFVVIWLISTFVEVINKVQELQASGQFDALAQQYP